MTQKDKINKFKAIDLHNGIVVNIVDGRDGKVAEINLNGNKKKMSPEDIDTLVDALTGAKQWLKDLKM
jgi:hypothetical protein